MHSGLLLWAGRPQTRQALPSLTVLTELHHGLHHVRSCSSTAASQQGTIDVDKILVANRGEIACRVIHTAKRLGEPVLTRLETKLMNEINTSFPGFDPLKLF